MKNYSIFVLYFTNKGLYDSIITGNHSSILSHQLNKVTDINKIYDTISECIIDSDIIVVINKNIKKQHLNNLVTTLQMMNKDESYGILLEKYKTYEAYPDYGVVDLMYSFLKKHKDLVNELYP